MVDKGRRRRLAGAAVAGTALALMATNVVVARGPDVGSPYEILTPLFGHAPSAAPSTPVEQPAPAAGPTRQHMAAVSGRPVCVRLCDGAFFPISTGGREADDEAACRGLCPDAETAVYLERKGSDDIADSVSKTGRPYSELPTALRYRTSLEKTCLCHRDLAPQYSLANDATLRKGDAVMTPNGLAVYDGARGLPHRAGDFVALAKARLPAQQRVELEALQRRHAAPRRGVRVTTP